MVDIDKPTCLFKDCTSPPEPLAHPAVGGLGLCLHHDRLLTARVNGRRQLFKNVISTDEDSWVYFVRGMPRFEEFGVRASLLALGPGPFIKIGSTRGVRGRMHAYDGELLLVEPGGRRYEGRLQAMFWQSWAAGEWFWPTDEVIDYVSGGQRRFAITPLKLRAGDSLLHIGWKKRMHRHIEAYCGIRLPPGEGVDSVGRFADVTCPKCRQRFQEMPEEVAPPRLSLSD